MRYWKRVDDGGHTTTVESYSHALAINGAIEIGKADYDYFLSTLPTPEAEINLQDILGEIKSRLAKIESQVGLTSPEETA